MSSTAAGRTRSSADDASQPAPAASRPPWILNRWADSLLVIGSPLLVIAAISVARLGFSGTAITGFVMIWAIGHHLPGMMRAYGDPGLFQRFRLRFVVAPLVLVGACVFSLLTNNQGVWAIAAIWGWWHYLMQAYGFSRIYDAKAGSFAARTRWLDHAMCLAWFAAAVVLNDNSLYGFVSRFHEAGVPLGRLDFIPTLRSVVRGATAAVTIMFVVNWVTDWYAGRSPSWIKPILMVTTFGCFWYSAATVTNIVVAYAFFELFHDAQYLTIVWAFNRNRAARDRSLTGFTAWLFRPRVMFVSIYLLMVFGYGALKWGSEFVSAELWYEILAAVFLASTLLHYYFDGFIWKLRDPATRESLDVGAGSGGWKRFEFRRGAAHAAMWLLFVVPFVGMLLTQAQTRVLMLQNPTVAAQRAALETQNIARVLPHSYLAQYKLGIVLKQLNQPEAARDALERAVQLNPTYTDAQRGLDDLTEAY